MRILIIAILSILLSSSAQANFTKATLQASGLTCALCSKAIFTAIEKLSYVEKVKANIKESSFEITFKQNTTPDFDEMRKAVEGAGFSVAGLHVTINFTKQDIKNDSHITINGKNLHFLGITPQTIEGEKIIKVVDKNFVATKVYKKYAATTKMVCVKTGVMENCCTKNNSTEQRIYHVTL
jgi:copper chaperone CopZ